jgi:hypothetical protein
MIFFIEKFYNIKIKVVLSGNLDYYQEYSWINAIHYNNGIFIVLSKESIFLDENVVTNFLKWSKKHSFKYDGDYAFFYCSNAMDIYIKAGFVKKDQCFIVGSPRMDALLEIEFTNEDDGKILLLCFMDKMYFGVNLWNDLLDILYNDKSLKNKVIIKCKMKKQINIIKQKYPDFNCVSFSIVDSLKRKPSVVVGFNTTALLDAFIVGIPIVIPSWGDARIFSVLKNNVNAKDKNEFLKLIKNIDSIDNSMNNLEDVVTKYYSFMDGKCRTRFFEKLNEIVL